jgi:pteridine reductase
VGLIELRGQTALITGAARRVGRCIALALADRGVNIFVHYNRSGDAAESLGAEIRGRGVEAWPLRGALESPDQIESMWEQALESSPGRRISLLEINALAPLRLIRLFAAQQGTGGIVNLLDSRIGGYMKRHVSYALSKRMLFSLTRMLALELAPRVRVNAVAPGMILAPEGVPGQELDRLAARTPLGRWGEPEDVANAVLFLLESDYVTGQVIFADGGAFMREDLYG